MRYWAIRISNLISVWRNLLVLDRRLEDLAFRQAEIFFSGIHFQRLENFCDAGLKVFSQWDEDGKIAWLVKKLKITTHTFVEFGVQDYTESNTRYLLMAKGWKGVVIDASKKNCEKIRSSHYFWKTNLVVSQSFVTAENINDLVNESTCGGPIGLLSIDIDGMDYYVWEALNGVEPPIVICEFNPRFSDDPLKKIVVPYSAEFDRTKAHYSNQYFGASLGALVDLALRKGYEFVGLNSGHNNAFFVRKELCIKYGLETQPVCAVELRFCDSRDLNGKLANKHIGLSGTGLPVINLEKKAIEYL